MEVLTYKRRGWVRGSYEGSKSGRVQGSVQVLHVW